MPKQPSFPPELSSPPVKSAELPPAMAEPDWSGPELCDSSSEEERRAQESSSESETDSDDEVDCIEHFVGQNVPEPEQSQLNALANPQPSSPDVSKESKCQFFVGDLSLDSFRLYLGAWNTPKFSEADIAKSLRDEQADRYQPKSSNFVPHRTDENGNVILCTEEEIANHEHHAKSEALRLRLELEPENTTRDSFFVDGSTERVIYCRRDAKTLTKN